MSAVAECSTLIDQGASVCLTGRQRTGDTDVGGPDVGGPAVSQQLTSTQLTVVQALREADRFALKRIFHSSAAPPIGQVSGEFDGELLDQGNGLIRAMVRRSFGVRRPWLGKAFHPINAHCGVGYNCFLGGGEPVQGCPLDTAITCSIIDARPVMTIDYRSRNRGPIRWLDGEVRQVIPSIWLGLGMFGPRLGRRTRWSRKIPFLLVGPRRPYGCASQTA